MTAAAAFDPQHPAERALALLLKPRVTEADRQACARILLTEMGPQLLRHIKRKSGLSDDDAEEALTDAIMNFIKTPPKQGTAGGWLHVTAAHRGLDIVRRDGTVTRGGEHEHISLDASFGDEHEERGSPGIQIASEESVEATVAYRQLHRAIFDKFTAAAPTYVQALKLIVLGHTELEIAHELGISKVAAKSKIHEVRTLARKFFPKD